MGMLVLLLVGFALPAWADTPASSAGSPREIAQRGNARARPPAKSAGKTPANAPAKATREARVDKALEARVSAFVQEHHRELFELLIYLKEALPREYERAVRDLDRTQQRLASLRHRDVERYELELQLWQAESRAQLLAARIQMKLGESQPLQDQLRAALGSAHDVRLQLLTRDRERLTERLRKLDQQLEKLQSNRDGSIDRQFDALVKPAGPSRPANQPTSTAIPD
jgi:hypothetical protein